MIDFIVLTALALGFYVFSRLMLKEPLIPWGAKKKRVSKQGTSKSKGKASKGKKGKKSVGDEDEPDPFEELFSDMEEIVKKMIRFENDRFVMIAEVDPVNYFLLSPEEQEAIDRTFETWLATLHYPVQIYLQNRYVDLSDPIEKMRDIMLGQDDLPINAIEYGQSMIEDLTRWQELTPRYETKRYLAVSYQVNVKEINADSKDELEEKILQKAYNELSRRVSAAANALRKARIGVHRLDNDGIGELLYFAFNRKKAIKNRYKDIARNEMLALYTTADQDERHIELVKEMIDRDGEEKEQQAG
ncbi:hypothetical protein [Priestia koreensis]|uniref:hypothetical protein n=1 Tax=Priestia koreensis TaxID=284581 RepID=UPI001F588698|nr:hypothetical protein [Priestia koreensis]UNL87423.1 hypothetical protein IE339_24195 [Priestia koreensis]